jgi:outer membrane protein OmpA-like peptidoglycan-associated protein
MMARTIILGAALAAVLPAVGHAGIVTTKKKAEPVAALSEVKFRFDSSELAASAPGALNAAVRYAATHPNVRIVLDAYCDPIGTAPYNIGLAIRRAEAVRHQLKAMGMSDDQIVFAIYGEGGQHRASFADDRRVTLWSSRDSLSAVFEHTVARDGTAVVWQRPLTTAEIEAVPVLTVAWH